MPSTYDAVSSTGVSPHAVACKVACILQRRLQGHTVILPSRL